MTIWLSWFHLIVPTFFPDALGPKKLAPKGDQNESVEQPADALYPLNVPLVETKPAPQGGEKELPQHPHKSVVIGPQDPEPGKIEKGSDPVQEYFLSAGLNSSGAVVDYVELTDKQRYPEFDLRGHRARILGSDDRTLLRTFAIRSPQVEETLGGIPLDFINWEAVPAADPKDAERLATFRLKSPDGKWELIKQFELRPLTEEERKTSDIRKTLAAGYELKLKFTARNLTGEEQQLKYQLQGPVGVPLEDAENSYKYRDVRMGFLRDDNTTVDENKLTAAEVVKKAKNDKTEVWKRKLKYIGIDVRYFAALVLPNPNQVDSSKAVIAFEDKTKADYSDVSVELTSSMKVAANSETSHEYTMFAGPKRKELMSQLSAIGIMDYGWFDPICRAMVWVLNMFHSLGLSYGLAIICLTVLVRTMLIPISKHQAANAARMKELQPKIMAKQKELEAKYGKNTDEYMRAAQELSKEQLGMMMGGCLPLFLQLPIFIALYSAIGNSIELRMEPFLWFENLASPDALFKLPFIVPWFGWTHFNLLPLISTGLMYVHQKLTMPPPQNEEQAQQQKMMGFMMIFMGVMFYRVPSGLCLYFIATNVWSMTERWLFEHWKKNAPATGDLALAGASDSTSTAANTIVVTPTKQSATQKQEPAKPGALGSIWARLQEAADSQKTASKQLEKSNRDNRDNRKKKKR